MAIISLKIILSLLSGGMKAFDVIGSIWVGVIGNISVIQIIINLSMWCVWGCHNIIVVILSMRHIIHVR
jgi:hypothetical protein